MKYIKLYEEIKQHNPNIIKCMMFIKTVLESLNFKVIVGSNDIIASGKSNWDIDFMIFINYYKYQKDELYLKILQDGTVYYTLYEGTEEVFVKYIYSEFTKEIIDHIYNRIDDRYLVDDENMNYILTNNPEYIEYYKYFLDGEYGQPVSPEMKEKYAYLLKNDLF